MRLECDTEMECTIQDGDDHKTGINDISALEQVSNQIPTVTLNGRGSVFQLVARHKNAFYR